MNIKDAIEKVIEKEPLFTALVLSLKVQEDDTIPTLGTDGEVLAYNPKFLDSLTKGEAAATVLHETLHCAFSHLWRRGARNAMKWNMATDYAINTIVNESFPLPKGSLIESKYIGLSAEQIYERLPDDNKKQQEWCEKSQWEQKKSSSPSNPQTTIEKEIQKIFEKMSSGRMTPQEKASSIARKWEELFERTITRQYGKMPQSMRRVIESTYYKPVINWQELVQNLLSEDITDYSFSQPDRRFLEDDFTLPDMFSYDRLKDIVFAYDTSGSINEHDLFTFYMETLSLFNNFSSLSGWIAICDAALHNFTEITPAQGFDEFQFKGGGGTSFKPVFEKIEKEGLNPKALFYFTDTEGSFPAKEPNYPVFWLVREDMGTRIDVPFGKVIRFKS